MTDRKLTQAELLAEAQTLFGPDPLDIAFKCPACGDTATIREFPDDTKHLAGQECIGRSLGALKGDLRFDAKGAQRGQAKRGCDWTSYGLLRGPWEIVMPDGHSGWSFELAEKPDVETALTGLRAPTSLDVAGILDEAANIIGRNGLATGEFYRPAFGDDGAVDARECRVCAYGAIRVAGGSDPDEPFRPGSVGVRAATAFGDHLVGLTGEVPLGDCTDEDLIAVIGGWNDEHTQEQVMAELRACAAETRKAIKV